VSSKLAERIDFEIKQLHQLCKEGRRLIDGSKINPPDLADRWALGAMLQAFYNGIENIFKQVAATYDGKPSKSNQWHADLLTLMSHSTTKRPAVVSQNLYEIVRKYLGFRHIFLNIYTHELRWESMADLVAQVDRTLTILENELHLFIEHSVVSE
jgi:hypothetical protein